MPLEISPVLSKSQTNQFYYPRMLPPLVFSQLKKIYVKIKCNQKKAIFPFPKLNHGYFFFINPNMSSFYRHRNLTKKKTIVLFVQI